MPITRSAALGVGQAAAGVDHPFYTVPTGEKALVKSWTIQVLGSASDVYLRVITPAGELNILHIKTVADFEIQFQELWHVLEEGYQLAILSQQTAVDFYVSGTRLVSTSP